MKQLHAAILTLAIAAVFTLPLTCICQLMQVQGLYTPAPHLLLLGHAHHPTMPNMAAMMSDSAFSQQYDDYVTASAGHIDYVYVATEEQDTAASISGKGCAMNGHSDALDFNPMLVATLPHAAPIAYHPDLSVWGKHGPPFAPQFVPAPLSPPPPALVLGCFKP